jgi:Calcineurin-like phosphoesterase
MVRPPVSVSTRQCACISALLFLVLISLAWAGPVKTPLDQRESVVAIGDVHGDFDDFVTILQLAGLIDAQHHWTGNQTTLVQVGDLLDRGPKPREVMDLMISLEKEAPKAGGRVVSLLGNQEMMNLMGDLRYVTAENYASFANSNSAERQRSAYQEYVKWRSSHAQLVAELPQPMELTEAEWIARHPPGFVEQREAFSPSGSYGKWLRGHFAVAKIGGVIFLHGGLHPDLANLKLDAINDRIQDEIKAFDAVKQYLQDEKLILPFFNLQEITATVQAELVAEHKSRVPANEQRQARLTQFLRSGDWLSVRVDGPLWFRGYDQWSEEEGAAKVDKFLDAYKAMHIVVGHTVQKGGRIRSRFGGKVFLIDTGMLSSYYPGGRPSALEIRGDTKFTAEYTDQRVVLFGSDESSLQNGGPGGPAGIGDSARISEARRPLGLCHQPSCNKSAPR